MKQNFASFGHFSCLLCLSIVKVCCTILYNLTIKLFVFSVKFVVAITLRFQLLFQSSNVFEFNVDQEEKWETAALFPPHLKQKTKQNKRQSTSAYIKEPRQLFAL